MAARKGGKKPQKKIKVEFELTTDEVKELIQSGTKGPKKITAAQVQKLAKAGKIRAADYLDANQQTMVIGKLVKLASKAASKASSKLSDKTTQRVVVTEAANVVADMVTTGAIAKKRSKKPKG